MRMRTDLLSQCVGFVDQGVELGLGGLGRVDLVRQRKNATGGVYFDHVGAVLDVSPHRGPRRVRAIDDLFWALTRPHTSADVHRVAVPTGGADRVGGDEHSWTDDRPLADRISHPHVHQLLSTEVANGGESGEERLSRALHPAEGSVWDGELEAVDPILFPIL